MAAMTEWTHKFNLPTLTPDYRLHLGYPGRFKVLSEQGHRSLCYAVCAYLQQMHPELGERFVQVSFSSSASNAHCPSANGRGHADGERRAPVAIIMRMAHSAWESGCASQNVARTSGGLRFHVRVGVHVPGGLGSLGRLSGPAFSAAGTCDDAYMGLSVRFQDIYAPLLVVLTVGFLPARGVI